MAIALLLVLLVAVLGFVVWDLYQRSRRSVTLQVPGGLRFEAQRFTLQVLRREQELRVKCGRGVLKPAAAAAPLPPGPAPWLAGVQRSGPSSSLHSSRSLTCCRVRHAGFWRGI